ncbi:MAG: oxidoreductase [Actinomycetes bacterium]
MVDRTQALKRLLDLPGVTDAVTAARDGVDGLLWDRSLRTKGLALAADVSLQCARSSAAIDGIDLALMAWSSGSAFDDSPMGRAAAGMWRMESELRSLLPVWTSAPTQALTRMHSLLVAEVVADDELGRPRSGQDVDDPLHIKALPGTDAMTVRLTALTDVVVASPVVPAVVEAAIVHGELLALRPFRSGSGPIARAAMRLVLSARGLDPDLLVMTDVAIMSIGRPAYVSAIRGYATGTADGVSDWIRFCAQATAVGARLSVERLAELE